MRACLQRQLLCRSMWLENRRSLTSSGSCFQYATIWLRGYPPPILCEQVRHFQQVTSSHAPQSPLLIDLARRVVSVKDLRVATNVAIPDPSAILFGSRSIQSHCAPNGGNYLQKISK